MFAYYMQLFAAFIMFMVFGLLFSPFFGGCFFLVAFFILLSMFIIFFSLNFIWFLLAGALIYAVSFFAKYKKWQKLDELNGYLAKNPACRLEVGVSCNKCNSHDIEHRGLFNRKSKFRFYICRQCGSLLFRFKVL